MRSRIVYLKVGGVIVFIAVAVAFVLRLDYQQLEYQDEYAAKAGGYADFFRTVTVPIGESESGYLPGYRFEELQKLKKKKSLRKSAFSDTLIWEPRGPYNIGGRTRSLLIDPDDPTQSTWYAGTAGGGIWKTEDAGETWTDLAPELPNLATIALAMAESNHDIIYAGTGEGFGGVGMITGDGLFKTEDRGTTWSRVESTRHPDFYYINDIWIAPDDPDNLLLATNRGIYRTIDGGISWDTVYRSGNRVQDLAFNPEIPSTIYAGVNSIGVIRSYNSGVTWSEANEGMKDVLRVSVDVSPADTAYIFATAQMNNGDMAIYLSRNGGETWLPNEEDENFINFHRAQGWFNNTLAADPYDRNKVYVGGVYLGAINFQEGTGQSEPTILNVDTVNTSSFLDFINFGGSELGGGMSTGFEEGADVEEGDFISVEIRFGPGKSQKAHRFQVPEGEGPGVPRNDYTYYDYIDVPFEVWDVTNNRQLMVSVRDQERDGEFNLIERIEGDEIPGREYIFVNAVDYDPVNPEPDIAQSGGHYHKMVYFFWPTLADGGEWIPSSLPEGKIFIEYGSYTIRFAATDVISSGTRNTNLHVDHHDLVVLPGAGPDDERTIISANDGGVAISDDSGDSWDQLTNGFYTTQFYGIAKKPGAEEYIGGMQDNGTWRSPNNEVATDEIDYEYMLSGDGFELLWHPERASWIIGTIYNNAIYRTSNSGAIWSGSSQGLPTDPNTAFERPFITKLSHSRQRPDTVYTIDARGVYRHPRFASPNTSWEFTAIEEGLDYFGNATSVLDVEVSKADPSVVWGGQGMFEDPNLDIFVSDDYAESFTAVSKYTEVELGFISAIETHPVDPDVAYLLFGYQGKPKILRTEDRGETWVDISGFGTDTVSSNGFPDVVVLSLLVMPHDPNVIWAGTEIGIVESVDNGETWMLLENEFPNVSVYQMLYQDNQIVLGTHGRGIWTAGDSIQIDTSGTDMVPEIQAPLYEMKVYPNPASENVTLRLSSAIPGEVSIRIMSISGQVVMQETRMIENENAMIHLNIDDLEPGTYLLRAISGNRSKTQQLVVY